MNLTLEIYHSIKWSHPKYCLYFTLAKQLLILCVATR
jgi:hypothetical protein